MTLDVSYHPDATAELRVDIAWYEERHVDWAIASRPKSTPSSTESFSGPSRVQCGPGWDSIPVVRSLRLADFP